MLEFTGLNGGFATVTLGAVVDPEFPRQGGVNPQGRDTNLLLGYNFPENYMKMKEIGARGGTHP